MIEAARDDAESEQEVLDQVFDDYQDADDMEEDSTELPARATEEPEEPEQEQRAQQDVIVTHGPQGLPHFVAVPQQTFVARAPLTPATSRFVPTRLSSVVHTDDAHHVLHAAAPAPAIVRAVATPVAAPIATPVVTPGVSSGFFTFPGAGIAFQF